MQKHTMMILLVQWWCIYLDAPLACDGIASADEIMFLHGDHKLLSNVEGDYSRLWLKRTAVTDEEVTVALGRLPSVRELVIENCASFYGTDMPESFLQNAISVIVLESPVKDEFLEQLQSCRHLQTLKFRHTAVTSSAFERCRLPESLVHLEITHAPFSDTAFRLLCAMKTLKTLRLNGCAVSDEGIRRVLPTLGVMLFSVENTPVTDDCVLGLINCKSLLAVNISYTSISPNGVAALLDSTAIDKLEISGHSVNETISAAICRSQSLRYLVACGSFAAISDLENVLAKSHLETVVIARKDFSEAAVYAMARRLPHVHIEFR